MTSEDIAIRIEMATSEIEGGSAVAWADPDRLVGIVANSEPAGAFEKYLLPNLLTQDLVDAAAAPALPETARRLLAALENTHKRLYRENRSVMKDPHWIQIRCALIEGCQLHLMGCGLAWAYVIRGQQAHLLETDGEETIESEKQPSEDHPAALGRESTMRLKVLTLDLEPNDQVVLVTCEKPPAPDLRAVASAFHQIQDLKRGCDGLVNLLGVQGSSGAAVAFRLIPVSAAITQSARSEAGQEVLGELVAEVESMSIAMGQEAERRGEIAADEPSAGLPVGKAQEHLRQETGESVPKETVLAQEVSWRPSYSRESASRLPIFLWIVFIALLSLVGVATLYKPGWREVRERIQGIFEGKGEGAGFHLSLSVPAPGDEMVAGGESGGKTSLGTGAPGTIPVIPETTMTSDAEILPELATVPTLPPGKGLVELVPRQRAKEAFAWTGSHEKRKAAPCAFLLTPGWARVYYEDEEIALWSHQVFVEEGGTTWVRVEPPPADDEASLHVESFHLEEGQGFVPADNDSVFLDGELLGLTPWDGGIEPGWHSLRVASVDGRQGVEVFNVSEGQSRYFVPRLGLQLLSSFRHTSPGQVLLRGPILLSVEIDTPEGESVHEPLLHIIPPGRVPKDVTLAPVDPSRGLYVGAVDPEHVRIGERVKYYFSCLSEGGTPSFSELYTLIPVNELSDLQSP